MKLFHYLCLGGTAAVALFCGSPALADPVTYSGEDIATSTTGPHPNSTTAAAAYDAAVATSGGSASLVTFENVPTGSFTSLTIAPGVTLTGTTYSGDGQSINNAPNAAFPTLDGYNTTAGGAKFLEIMGGTATFTFAAPVYAFGTYLTGIQTSFFTDVINFSDGTSQTITVPGAGTSGATGAIDFVGFTDIGKAISSITVNAGAPPNGSDFIGLDDVRFATQAVASAAPEPAAWAMMMLGFGAIGYAIRRRRSDRPAAYGAY